MIKTVNIDSIEYEMYRNSLVKTFEMTLELFDDISKAMQNEILKKYIVIYP